MIYSPTSHREVQEAIDKATNFLLESEKAGIAYGTAMTEKHLENLYKIQIALLSRVESK